MPFYAGGKLHWLARDLPFPYEHLVENVTDPAHLPFSHHKTFGGQTREVAGAMPMRPLRIEPAPKGVHAAAAAGAGTRAGARVGVAAAAHAAAGAGAAAGAAEEAKAQQPSIPQPLFTEQLPLHLSPDTRFSFYPPGFVTAHFTWVSSVLGVLGE